MLLISFLDRKDMPLYKCTAIPAVYEHRFCCYSIEPPGLLKLISVGLNGRSFVKIPAGPTFRVYKITEQKVLPCNNICKRLDFPVLSDKDDKLQAPSHKPCTCNKFGETLKNPHSLRKEQGSQSPVQWSISNSH